MSVGRRIALEIREAKEQGRLEGDSDLT